LEYLFSDKEKNIVQKLKNSMPKRIWTEFVKVIFEFDNHYVELECLPRKANSQNNGDEAMTVNIREFEKKYKSLNYSKTLVEKRKITDIKIVRTLLYFTDSITEPNKVKKMDSHLNKILSKIAGVRKSKIEKILDGSSSSYHSEVLCRPNSKESKEINTEYTNLIDVGLLVEFENEYLAAIVQGNGFGFTHLDRKPILTIEELEKELDNYELN
jgi:hypothetical protein